MIDSLISSFVDMNFVLSAMTNLFLGLVFLLMIDLFFKSQVYQVFGIRHDGDFHNCLESRCSQREIRYLIFSTFFHVVF